MGIEAVGEEPSGRSTRALREHLGLTQAELACMLGVHAMTVSKWERGSGYPSPYNLQQMGLLALGASRLSGSDRLAFRGLLALGSGVGALAFIVMRGMAQVSGDAGLVGDA